jgi:hypothetical protein
VSTIEAADARVERIAQAIYLIRGQRVMLDDDLAGVYGVKTHRLNEQVRRNIARFPEDFMFKLSPEEWDGLRSQIATSNKGRGGRRYLPLAFTEHGAIMAAAVLNTPQAVEMSVVVVRSFVRLRQMKQSPEDLWRKVLALEKKYDRQLGDVFDAIRALMEPPATSRRTIGFIAPSSGKKTRARR